MTKTMQQIENNSQTDYFNSLPNKKQKNEENRVFDLVLVDISKSYDDIKCVKENMYDPELKYICISYRWGELNEQQLKTPNYTAHTTSFLLWDLVRLCEHIKNEPDLKEIPYLWIDTISVDQQNKEGKKDIILKMNQIYQHASYILAVPDLHQEYLLKNTASNEILDLIRYEYYEAIYNEIFNNKLSDNDSINDNINSPINTNLTLQSDSTSTSEQLINNHDQNSFNQILTTELLKKMEEIENKELKLEIKKLIIEMKKNELKKEKEKIYHFLAYLIEDWSNRAWVISEYHIAKEKYIKYRTPLKYIFISLLNYDLNGSPFFSYHFNDNDDQQNIINNNELNYQEVNDPISFNQFVKSRFMQRSHLDMILNSNATRNEDRFNAILPSWNKYNHLIKNKNTISDWNITDMTSVRLKLYEIMDLWDKATLLSACRKGSILPTFASYYDIYYSNIIEKMDYNNVVYKQFEISLLGYINNEEAIKIEQLMDEYKTYSKSIWNENLTSIQFDKHHCYLSVKSNSYFIMDEDPYEEEDCRNKLSLDEDDEIHSAFIPFFTSNLPGYINYLPIYEKGSKIYLIGNKKKNKWVLNYDYISNYKSGYFCIDDYTFNIY